MTKAEKVAFIKAAGDFYRQQVDKVIDDIKKAQKLPNEPNLKPHQKPDVSHYEVYRGNLGDHYIENLKRDQRRYYITKDTPDHSIPTASRGAIESANNIIPSFLSDFNPPKWVNPQTTTLGQTINSHIQNNIPSFDFNTAVTTRGNNQQTPTYDKIFSPEDIGGFSGEEFAKHEKEIRGQWGSIGIPTNNKLQSSGAVYIAPYTRSDGVQVKGHYRSR